MKEYKVEEIRIRIVSRFKEGGLSDLHANEMANQLLYAELRNITSHGLVRVKWVLEQIHKYQNQKLIQLIANDNIELYDGKDMLGYFALNEIVENQTFSNGKTIKFIGARNTYPTGALSYFAEKLAAKGWIVIMSSTSPRRVGLYGDKNPLVGTNPWTFSLPVPTQYGGHVIVDTSLAQLTHGQCLNMLMKRQDLPEYTVSLPGGLKVKEAEDLWNDGKWKAIIHPVGGQNSYKSFSIMWSLHLLGSGFLGLNEEQYGTFFILMSPEIWEPVIPRNEIFKAFMREVELLRNSEVAHVPGEGKMQHFHENKDKIIISEELEKII